MVLLVLIALAFSHWSDWSDEEIGVLRVRACEHITRTLPDGTVVVKWACPNALK